MIDKERALQLPPTPEEVLKRALRTTGRFAVRMDQIITPGLNPQLEVSVRRDEDGLVTFHSTNPRFELPTGEKLFDGPINPNNN